MDKPLDLTQATDKLDRPLTDKLMTLDPTPVNKSHRPIAHADFYRAVSAGIEQVGEQVATRHATMAKGAIYIGLSELATTSTRVAPILAWRVSHTQRFAATLYVGLGVRGVNNFCFSSEIPLGVPGIGWEARITTLIGEAAREIRAAFSIHAAALKRLDELAISETQAMMEITRLYRAEVLHSSRLGFIIHDWYAPPDVSLRQANGWRLFNIICAYYKPAQTVMTQGSPGTLLNLMERSQRLFEEANRWPDRFG